MRSCFVFSLISPCVFWIVKSAETVIGSLFIRRWINYNRTRQVLNSFIGKRWQILTTLVKTAREIVGSPDTRKPEFAGIWEKTGRTGFFRPFRIQEVAWSFEHTSHWLINKWFITKVLRNKFGKICHRNFQRLLTIRITSLDRARRFTSLFAKFWDHCLKLEIFLNYRAFI